MEVFLEEERGSVSLLRRGRNCTKYARGLAMHQYGWEGNLIGSFGSEDCYSGKKAESKLRIF
jgi:hypothetical protein